MIEATLQRARLLIEQRRYKEAEKELQRSLASDPVNPETLSLLAVCKSNDKKYEEAEELIRSAISISPDDPFLIYIYAKILFDQNKYRESEKNVREAIRINPFNAAFFGLLAAIFLNRKEWTKSLEYANKGLEISPDNLTCLNIRSTALIKLDKKEESYNTINEALNHDPNNAATHANLAWGLLEKGDHKKALIHFQRSLQLDPESAFAKQGLVEALKARYWIYRIFLRYRFWISNMKSGAQWGIMIGLYAASRVVNFVAESQPALEPFLMPLVYLYVAFALSTWIIVPVTNLFLRLNVYGKYALTKKEIETSTFVGIFLVLAIASFLICLFIPSAFFFMLGLFGVTMLIPVSSMLMPDTAKGKTILIAYAVGLGLAGVLGLFLLLTGRFQLFDTVAAIYLIGIFLYQWVANGTIRG